MAARPHRRPFPGARSLPVTLGLALALALVAAACSSAGGSPGAAGGSPGSPGSSGAAKPSLFPVVANNDLAVGDDRFLFLFVTQSGGPIADPKRTASVAFFPGDGGGAIPTGSPAVTATGTFEWGIPNQTGYYVAPVTFPSAGPWTAVFTTATGGAPPDRIPVVFDVREKHQAVMVGEKAPATKTPTLADVGGDVAKISTDTKPDPRFYTTSVDQALAKHEPFVLVFATPAFCQSRLCGPTLDRVKALAAKYPDMTFINVEPYKLQSVGGRLQPVLDANNQLQATDVTDAWRIPSEPWVFVVDKDGIVRASFEAVFGDDELAAAIDTVK